MAATGWIEVLACAELLTAAAAGWMAYRHSRRFAHAQGYLKRAKEEVREILQLSLSNPYPLVQVSAQGEVLFINPTANELFPGLSELGLKHPLLSSLEMDGALAREVIVDGQYYHQTIEPMKAQGEDSFIIYSYDITAQKRYQQELREARIAAENANQARGDFLANMSHELRTPMNGIIGFSDMLLEEELPERHRQMIRAVNHSAHNLLALLNDILDFSKIEAGELTIEAIAFDPRQVVAQIASLQGVAARRKGLEMHEIVSEKVPARLVGDPARLQQILNNLASNAIKFTHEGSVILSLEGEEDAMGRFVMRLSVADTGIGIPKDKQEKVFVKFQQADTSTARKYGGTGLGLAITKDLAELMGGRISIASEEGRGTTFTVTLPAAIVPAEAEERQAGEVVTLLRLNTKARVMLVDDNPVNLMFLRLKLQQLGFSRLVEAATGKEALEQLSHYPCDLIFMDGQMPEMDGFEASRRIRAMEGLSPRPVIVAVTADAMKGAAEKCKVAGMDDYISKPIEKEALYAMLGRWLPAPEGEEEETPAMEETVIQAQEILSGNVIDWGRFRSFTDGDAQVEAEMIEMFLTNAGQDVEELKRCFSAAEYENWIGTAHKLFGSASLIGATALSEACDKAQYLNAQVDAEQIPAMHQAIVGGFAEARNALTIKQAA